MTWLLASGLIAAVGVIGALSVAAWWFGRRALARADRLGDVREEKAQLERLNDKWKRTVDDLEQGLANRTAEVARQIAARKQAEEAARNAIDELAKGGSAPAVVSALNERLQALSRLSNMSTGAASEDRDGDGAVHGGLPEGNGADDPVPG
jgi:C4-dicarboxylate-specific signal transduction histidine kinase